MSSLASLQRSLQKFIVDGEEREHLAGESIAQAIDSSAAISAATRLQIYSDAYRLRLIEALQTNYPALERLVGAGRFQRLTQLYLSMRPSQHFSIRWFGHELPQFLRAFDECRDEPWLAELAEWEWNIAASFDERDVEPLRADALAKIAPEEWPTLRLALHPSVRRISLCTNAAAIAKAAGEDQPLPFPSRLDRVQWLIWRQDLVVRFRSLATLETTALDAVQNGSTFGELCEAIAQHIDADSVPQKAASFLRQWIDARLLADVAR